MIKNIHAYHLWQGLKHDYPLCCILYFCAIESRNKSKTLIPMLVDDYARCPECMQYYFINQKNRRGVR